MEINNKRSAFGRPVDFCVLAKPSDYIEVTEWINGEGYDVSISSEFDGTRFISFTHGQFKLIKKLIKKLSESEQ